LYKIISQHSGQTFDKVHKIVNVIIGWLLKKQKNTEWLMKYWEEEKNSYKFKFKV
jgi:hypothetical protein